MTGDAALVAHVAGRVARLSRQETEPLLKAALQRRKAVAATAAVIEKALQALTPTTSSPRPAVSGTAPRLP